MTVWTGAAVADALRVARTSEATTFAAIETDTRRLTPGALFVALSGPRFDGHDFLAAARSAGASGAVVRGGTPPVDGLVLFPVNDTLEALGRLAHARRQEVRGPVVAVTGSNGKTTTKEMLAAVLRTTWVTHATSANLNNLVGVPQTILAAPPDTEALVVEAGANERGEIARLRDIIAPSIGAVTNVAAAHLEGFGSLAGILGEKVSLLRDVPAAVVGTDPPALAEGAARVCARVVTAGLTPPAEVRPDAWRLDADGHVRLTWRGHDVRLPVPGRHQGSNAMVALAVAEELDLSDEAVAEAIQTVKFPGGRCETLRAGEFLVLHDAYNANPASLRAALDTAQAMRGDRRFVVVVGTMLELGDASAELHAQAARWILDAEPDLIGATGAFVPAFAAAGSEAAGGLVTGDDAVDLGRALRERLRGDEFILVKASRGVGLERAIDIVTGEGGA